MSQVMSASRAGRVLATSCSSSSRAKRGIANTGDAGAFGERLADTYRLLSNDDEALEAAKAVVQVLPWLDAPRDELHLAGRGVVARGRAVPRTQRGAEVGHASGGAKTLTLHLRLDGKSVDISAWARDRATVEELLAARDEVARALRDRGLTLRRLVAGEEAESAASGDTRGLFDDPTLKRSYMEVIA